MLILNVMLKKENEMVDISIQFSVDFRSNVKKLIQDRESEREIVILCRCVWREPRRPGHTEVSKLANSLR